MKLKKSLHQRTITGTLGGVSEYFSLDYAWLKVVFVILVFVTKGWLIVGYIILALLMPPPRLRLISRNLFLSEIRLLFKSAATRFLLLMSLKNYRILFSLTFLTMGVLWFAKPLHYITALLLIAGVVLIFSPFQRHTISSRHSKRPTQFMAFTPEIGGEIKARPN